MIKDGEYLFTSTLLRSSEKTGTDAERLAGFTDAASPEALRAFAARVFRLKESDIDEALLDEAMNDAVKKVRDAVPDFGVFAPLLYKYDCTNIKAALKCSVRGLDADDMLSGCGTVSPDRIINAAKTGDFSCLPHEMSLAAAAARDAYSQTHEARAFDLMLDRACFADMKSAADAGGVELIIKIVSIRADAANILSAMRIAASGASSDTAASLLGRALVAGGDIGQDTFFSSGKISTIKQLAARASSAAVYPALRRVADKSDISFSEAERIFDEAVLALCAPVKYKAFGAEIAVRFLLVREAEIMNCRIARAALDSTGSGADIRERMRKAYV